jgi:hypothetical protein
MRTTGQIWDIKIEEHLKPEMEGNLYEHIYLLSLGDKWHITKNYYAVLDGKVYSLEKGGDKRLSGDALFNTKSNCQHIGQYSPTENYQSIHKEYTPSELNKILFEL